MLRLDWISLNLALPELIKDYDFVDEFLRTFFLHKPHALMVMVR
jgi:hypothetical protein